MLQTTIVEKIIVIGGGVAGINAAIAARKESENIKITVIDQEEYPQYSRCGLPYLISEEIGDWKKLIKYDANFLRDKFKLDINLSTSVKKIDLQKRRIFTVDSIGKERILEYTKLIIATGAIPIKPAIRGMNLSNIFEMRTLNDALKVKEIAKKGRKIIIAGGGLVSVETAEALTKKGVKVTMVFLEDEVLSMVFDRDIGQIVRKKMEEHGVEIISSSKIEEFYGMKRIEAVKADGQILPCDYLILATGVKPNTQFLNGTGIPIGKYDGIIVNDKMETRIEGVYAAGDCVEIRNFITGENVPIQLATTAYRQGEIAGGNAAGGNRRMPKTINNVCAKVFGLEVASVGLSVHDTRRNGIEAYQSFVENIDKVEYFPGGKRTWTSLLFNKQNSNLIGAQFAGGSAATWGNFAALAIIERLSVEELANFETSYSPSVENFWVGITTATRKLIKMEEEQKKM